MFLGELEVINYKNLEQVKLELSPNVNCFLGHNGEGKTNLLDAIYYLSFCRSNFSSSDVYNIKHDEDFLMLKGKYTHGDQEDLVSFGVKKGGKKKVKRNDKEYKKLAEHIGLIPLVMVTPADISLIEGGSEERRRFLDAVIAQYDSSYLHHLISYNATLTQRNKLLKNIKGRADHEVLDILSSKMAHYGNYIHQKRAVFVKELIPIFQHYYQLISEQKETVKIDYQSQLHTRPFEELSKESLEKDLILKHTSAGTHRDDLLFKLGGYAIKKEGSQGQRKTFLIALKLAQFDFIKQRTAKNPLLLLDDIFDKLDAKRVSQIVQLVSSEHFGQIFLTDTNKDHIDSIVSASTLEYRIFEIAKGKVQPYA